METNLLLENIPLIEGFDPTDVVKFLTDERSPADGIRVNPAHLSRGQAYLWNQGTFRQHGMDLNTSVIKPSHAYRFYGPFFTGKIWEYSFFDFLLVSEP